MKKIVFLFFILMVSFGCAATNVNELRIKGKHDVYYTSDSLQNVYNRTIKRCNECGIYISNEFIDNNAGEASISLIYRNDSTQQFYWIAHSDIKEESENKIKIDVYGISTMGRPGQFMTLMQYIAENKDGCPK